MHLLMVVVQVAIFFIGLTGTIRNVPFGYVNHDKGYNNLFIGKDLIQEINAGGVLQLVSS